MTTTLAGFARTVNPATDIITAYAAAPYLPTPTPYPAPWVVLGSFTVPQQVQGRICVLGLMIGTAVCSVGIFDPTLIQTVSVVASQETQTFSEILQLFPDKTYQIAVKFQGTTDPGNIAVIRTVTLVP